MGKSKKIFVIAANELIFTPMLTRVTTKISFCSLPNKILPYTTAGVEAVLIYSGCILSAMTDVTAAHA